jgi:hypothetical protein
MWYHHDSVNPYLFFQNQLTYFYETWFEHFLFNLEVTTLLGRQCFTLLHHLLNVFVQLANERGFKQTKNVLHLTPGLHLRRSEKYG